jgi:hypothetical protein
MTIVPVGPEIRSPSTRRLPPVSTTITEDPLSMRSPCTTNVSPPTILTFFPITSVAFTTHTPSTHTASSVGFQQQRLHDDPPVVVEASVVEGEVVEAAVVEASVVEGEVVEAAVVEGEVVEAAVVEGEVVETSVVEGEVVEAAVVARGKSQRNGGIGCQVSSVQSESGSSITCQLFVKYKFELKLVLPR